MIAPWPGDRGLQAGRYLVEYYLNGQLMQVTGFDVPPAEEPTIGPIAFGTDCSSGGVPNVAATIFPAGVAELHAMVNYSGLPQGTIVWSDWYRDGALYARWSSDSLVEWGSQCFNLNDVPPGDYRFELTIEGQAEAVQSASFHVLAIGDYLQAIGPEPDDAIFHLDLGNAYAYAGDIQQAAAHYQQAIDRDPACAECYYRWWSVLYDQGDYAAAAEKLRQASNLRPNEYDYLSDLAETYYQLGDEAAAVAAYRQALPLNPGRIYNRWGNSLYSLERYAEAAHKYEQSLELEPDDEVKLANLGGAYHKLGRYKEAVAAFEQALALDPSFDTVYNKWGDVLYDQARYAEAAEKYRQAAELDPGEALYYSNLGWAGFQLGEHEPAAAAFQQAVELDPGRAGDWNMWGEVLYELERYAEAAEKHGQAAALRPGIALYHYNLGLDYYYLARDVEALAQFQEAADLAAQAGDQDLQQRAEEMIDVLQ
jgi:tetratricopeptide (TPR) repeat protein